MNSDMTTFDARRCHLGEGPLWHPRRNQLFWFDINAKQLLSQDENGPLQWQFDKHVSAAGWIDTDTLLIASETALFQFDLTTAKRAHVVDLEADNPITRSNDGRTDPWGGFWIGTMGKQAQAGAGAIYRFYKGKLEALFTGITISNAICFSPDAKYAYFTDTPTRVIMRQTLDPQGWPDGPAQPFIDLRADGLNPDGAVVDASGHLWNAQWSAHQISHYAPDGTLVDCVKVPVAQPSCPAFGGTDFSTLFCTSATEDLATTTHVDGTVQQLGTPVKGQAEHQVLVRTNDANGRH